MLVAGGGGTTAAGSESDVSFAALEGAGPTGLRLGPPVADTEPGEAAAPAFPAEPPAGAGDWPVASTVRRLDLGSSDFEAWIARSSQGGICVLLYDGTQATGVAPVYAGCSAPEEVARGAAIEVSEVPGRPGEVIAVGVVPDGVTSVSEVLADGSTATSPVSDNAWLRVGSVPAAEGERPNETRGS
ncbi:MAG TPA: hypothetical protein VN618_07940 [Solirubrobacteraceae bacterium]|nr:hypothetical protein [Solirubrobacteraceae bacterium]